MADLKGQVSQMLTVYSASLIILWFLADDLWLTLAKFNMVWGIMMLFGGLSGGKHNTARHNDDDADREDQSLPMAMVIFGGLNSASAVVIGMFCILRADPIK